MNTPLTRKREKKKEISTTKKREDKIGER